MTLTIPHPDRAFVVPHHRPDFTRKINASLARLLFTRSFPTRFTSSGNNPLDRRRDSELFSSRSLDKCQERSEINHQLLTHAVQLDLRLLDKTVDSRVGKITPTEFISPFTICGLANITTRCASPRERSVHHADTMSV